MGINTHHHLPKIISKPSLVLLDPWQIPLEYLKATGHCYSHMHFYLKLQHSLNDIHMFHYRIRRKSMLQIKRPSI